MRTVTVVLAFVAMLQATGTACAGEVIPYAGFRFGETLTEESTGNLLKMDETSSIGMMLTIDRDVSSTYDFLFSRQDTHIAPTASVPLDITIDYYQIGGTQYYPQKMLRSFISGGLGLTQVRPANSIYSSETNFMISIGGGVSVPLSERISLRFEGRGFGTFVGGDGSLLCENGQCVASFSGDLYVQVEILAGLSFTF
jgi:opacity protein-like surface antigen